ncbi:hypothetical protein BO83DRAFT_15375 [Aspergillus eucalypticola CBS 122712]|uniref:Uncharacterized protein n=1 Tax=Aspergillus eucalypticola (strain CBS 122712 / IBT 29274) TaxID=1448314 RepID=A0A317VSA1_ASPEC|nr:uncharacterized protein BO83DRAFT_15375 [Aspergillus eucalypticola CBS 122712]PWY74780.1 hypothetical protein BO83DRAFT_15375 [Aspergillus eucalypticola CBS 122712]
MCISMTLPKRQQRIVSPGETVFPFFASTKIPTFHTYEGLKKCVLLSSFQFSLSDSTKPHCKRWRGQDHSWDTSFDHKKTQLSIHLHLQEDPSAQSQASQAIPPSHERVCRLGASVANQMPVPVLPVKILLHPAAPYRAKHTTLHQLTHFFFRSRKRKQNPPYASGRECWQSSAADFRPNQDTSKHPTSCTMVQIMIPAWTDPVGAKVWSDRWGSFTLPPFLSFTKSEGGWLRDFIATR